MFIRLSILVCAGVAMFGCLRPVSHAEDAASMAAARAAFDRQVESQRAAVAEEHGAVTAQVERLEAQLAAARERQADLLRQKAAHEAAIATKRATAGEGEAAWQRLVAAARTQAAAGLGRVEHGLPHRRDERLREWRAIGALLALADVASQAEGLVKLIAAQSQAITASRQVLWESRTIQLGERRLPAYCLRLGLAVELFVSETGADVGVADGQSDGWQVVTDPTQQATIRQVLLIARGREPARLVEVPVTAGRGQ